MTMTTEKLLAWVKAKIEEAHTAAGLVLEAEQARVEAKRAWGIAERSAFLAAGEETEKGREARAKAKSADELRDLDMAIAQHNHKKRVADLRADEYKLVQSVVATLRGQA